MTIVFTDLDGTLLDPATYSFTAAIPALDRMAQHGIPCVLVTSKTRAEVEHCRGLLDNRHPFIAENGAAAFIPTDYFPFAIPGSVHRGAFEVLEWGKPYAGLVAAVKEASQSSQCLIRGFGDMSSRDVSMACGLPLGQAALAREREYDEPFEIVDSARAAALLREIEIRGLHWTRGGRFHHIHGSHGKAHAVQALVHLFRRLHEHVTTIGLGDAVNDTEFLEAVDIPVVVRSTSPANPVPRMPRAIFTDVPGPRGWNEAILHLIDVR